jgi:hypothetical protein
MDFVAVLKGTCHWFERTQENKGFHSTQCMYVWGHAVAQFLEALRYNRKVAESIPDRVTGVFH